MPMKHQGKENTCNTVTNTLKLWYNSFVAKIHHQLFSNGRRLKRAIPLVRRRVLRNLLLKRTFISSHNFVYLFPVSDEAKGRDAAYAPSSSHVIGLVYVNFQEDDFRVLRGQVCVHRRHVTARSTPCCCEVHD